MIFYDVCAELSGKRRVPKPCLVAVRMDFFNDRRKSVGELLQIHIPIADFRFVSVVDLEDICGVANVRKPFEVAQDDLLVYVLIIIVPRRVACKMLHSARTFCGVLGKILVENAIVRSVSVHDIEQLVFARQRQSLDVLLDGEHVFLHIRIENRISRALVERAEKLDLFVLAEVRIRKTVIQILAVFGESVVARSARKLPYERQFGERTQSVLHVAPFILSRGRPGLKTVCEKSLVVLEIVVVNEFGKVDLHVAFCAQHDFDVVFVAVVTQNDILALVSVFHERILNGFFFSLPRYTVAYLQRVVFYIHKFPRIYNIG